MCCSCVANVLLTMVDAQGDRDQRSWLALAPLLLQGPGHRLHTARDQGHDQRQPHQLRRNLRPAAEAPIRWGQSPAVLI